uniref:Uncharacterized protein n=1 Tax=Marseillevirus LCMAC103 TaxID=2506604 RepID=A0A481YVB8_9VIRU|nr:MAG: hypothetical protein LCMAC103_00640 [Marseillevirus LCMAC103]
MEIYEPRVSDGGAWSRDNLLGADGKIRYSTVVRRVTAFRPPTTDAEDAALAAVRTKNDDPKEFVGHVATATSGRPSRVIRAGADYIQGFNVPAGTATTVVSRVSPHGERTVLFTKMPDAQGRIQLEPDEAIPIRWMCCSDIVLEPPCTFTTEFVSILSHEMRSGELQDATGRDIDFGRYEPFVRADQKMAPLMRAAIPW